MIFVYAAIIFIVVETAAETNETISSSFDVQNVSASKVLSRRKRYLIFPDGSSVQLVICHQNHGYLQIGNIVWFGTTAALAWELPTDPEVFDMFRDQYKLYEGNRRSDVIYYLDEDGKVIDKRVYKRKVLVNPAFAKRSIDSTKKENKFNMKTSIKEMHNTQKDKNILEELDATRLNFYREERQQLYVKVQNFLQALGWDGESCVLKMLCLSAKANNVQGTFMDEIFRAVFTLPKVHGPSELHNQYDDAHGSDGDCSRLYPNCGHTSVI